MLILLGLCNVCVTTCVVYCVHNKTHHPTQANQRIIKSAADRLGVPSERVVCNLSKYGNTSAASIPLALDEAVREGNIKPGDVVAMAGFGAGLTWASAIVRWGAH